MRIDVTVPNVGESITEVEIGEWFKNKGDPVDKNEPLLTVESDKATVEIRAPESATLIDILKNSGDSAAVGEVIAHLEAKSGRASFPLVWRRSTSSGNSNRRCTSAAQAALKASR